MEDYTIEELREKLQNARMHLEQDSCTIEKVVEYLRPIDDYIHLMGKHDGECTNVGMEHEEACELHMAASRTRRDNALLALVQLKSILPY